MVIAHECFSFRIRKEVFFYCQLVTCMTTTTTLITLASSQPIAAPKVGAFVDVHGFWREGFLEMWPMSNEKGLIAQRAGFVY